MKDFDMDSWEYWEEKFRGMTEAQIKEYWVREMEEAQSETSILMDISDGEYGARADCVRKSFERFKTAKAKHESKEKAKQEESGENKKEEELEI